LTHPNLDGLTLGQSITFTDGSTVTVVEEDIIEEDEDVASPSLKKKKRGGKKGYGAKKKGGEGSSSSVTRDFIVPKKFTPEIDSKLKVKNAIYKDPELSKYFNIYLFLFF